MATSMEERLEQRKLDALKRGIHRIGKEPTVPFAVHLLGIGKAGADVIAETLAQLDADGPTFHALAVDIGDRDLGRVREAAARLPEGRARVETVALEVPSRDDLFGGLRRYREFLRPQPGPARVRGRTGKLYRGEELEGDRRPALRQSRRVAGPAREQRSRQRRKRRNRC